MLFGYLQNILSFTSSLFNVLLGFIISVYMLASREALVRSLKSICGLFMKEKWIAACSEYSHKISKIFYSYFYSTLLDACLIGIVISIGLWIIGGAQRAAAGHDGRPDEYHPLFRCYHWRGRLCNHRVPVR